MFPFLGGHIYVKNQRHWLIPSRYIDAQRIQQSDRFEHILVYNLKFCVINWWNITNVNLETN